MVKYLSESEAAREIVAAAGILFDTGVMSPSGHANLSARISETEMLMTSGGYVKHLDPATLAVVSLDETVIRGEIAPENAEIISMHARTYRARPGIAAIVHTHSPGPTAFAYAHEPLPVRAEPMLRFGQAVPVPVVPWAPRGSDESVGGIVRVLEGDPDTLAVLLANHGLLAFNTTPTATARLIVALQEAAEAELAASALGGAKDFPAGALAKVRASMARVAR